MKKVKLALIILIVLLGFGTFYFSETEDWSKTDAFYFSTMTLTTIGYGDYIPTTNVNKIIVSFYAIAGVGIMFYIFSSIVGGVLDFTIVTHRQHTKILNKKNKVIKRKNKAKKKNSKKR